MRTSSRVPGRVLALALLLLAGPLVGRGASDEDGPGPVRVEDLRVPDGGELVTLLADLEGTWTVRVDDDRAGAVLVRRDPRPRTVRLRLRAAPSGADTAGIVEAALPDVPTAAIPDGRPDERAVQPEAADGRTGRVRVVRVPDAGEDEGETVVRAVLAVLEPSGVGTPPDELAAVLDACRLETAEVRGPPSEPPAEASRVEIGPLAGSRSADVIVSVRRPGGWRSRSAEERVIWLSPGPDPTAGYLAIMAYARRDLPDDEDAGDMIRRLHPGAVEVEEASPVAVRIGGEDRQVALRRFRLGEDGPVALRGATIDAADLRLVVTGRGPVAEGGELADAFREILESLEIQVLERH